MTLEPQYYTESGMVDSIKNSFTNYKNSEYPISGDYFYNKIDAGILQNKIIEIPLSCLEKIKPSLELTTHEKIQIIIYKVIYQIFYDKFNGIAILAEKENRINWRFI